MKRTDSSRKKALKRNAVSYAFLAPWLIFFLIFTVFPFVYGIAISLFDFNYVEKTFIGLANYKTIISDEMFHTSVLATLKMVAIIVPGTVLISLWVSNTVRRRRKAMQSFTKAVFYLSAIISEVALVIVWKWIYNPGIGLTATICNLLGVGTLDWYGNVNLAVPLISILVSTFTIAQPIILYSAAMNNIPEIYYEAAKIDGASRWAQFKNITWPLIKHTTTFVLIITTILSLQVFAIPYLLTGGGPQFGTTTVLLMVYRNAFEYGRYGYASAMSVVLFAIIAIFAYFQFRFTKSDVQY